jgi:Double zinc ribbon
LATISCPRCHQIIDSQAINCPQCQLLLKAYGHPGIPLHRAQGNNNLCDSCTYHFDHTCNFPQYPYAQECTLYQNIEASKLELQQQNSHQRLSPKFNGWIKRHQTVLLILGLLLVCLLITLFTS